MSHADPRFKDQYTLTFSSNKLILAVCTTLMLLVLCVMLGIRIERYQTQQAALLKDRAGAPVAQAVAPHAPPATVQLAGMSTTPVREAAPTPQPAKRARAMTAEDLPDTIPAPTPILLEQASAPRPSVQRDARQPSASSDTRAAQTTAAPPASRTPAATQSGRGYVVQVVSSQDRTLADQRAKLLNVQGVPAFVESADLGGKGTWHRVLAGTYPSKTEANAMLAKLQTDPQFSASFVRPY